MHIESFFESDFMLHKQQEKFRYFFSFLKQILQLVGDISKKEVCEGYVDKTLAYFGELDVVV